MSTYDPHNSPMEKPDEIGRHIHSAAPPVNGICGKEIPSCAGTILIHAGRMKKR